MALYYQCHLSIFLCFFIFSIQYLCQLHKMAVKKWSGRRCGDWDGKCSQHPQTVSPMRRWGDRDSLAVEIWQRTLQVRFG